MTIRMKGNLKWNQLERTILIRRFGYDPYLPIERKLLIHRSFVRQKIFLLKETSIIEIINKIISVNVGFKIDEIVFSKKIIKCLKRISLLNFRVIHFKNFLQNITKEDKIYGVEDVKEFIHFIIDKCIPYKLFEKKKYFIRFKINCLNIIFASYKRSVFLADLMRGLNKKVDLQTRHIRAKIVIWLINIIMNILGCVFYVTEDSKCRDLLFYSHRYWIECQKSAVENLMKNGEIKNTKITLQDTGLSKMRFVPKPSGGLRPLVLKSTDHRNLKKLMTHCNLLLKQLIASKRGKYPNFIPDLHESWIEFYNKNCNFKENVYFVKMDIQNAYGSIKHNVLKNILNTLFDEYLKVELLSVQSCSYRGVWNIVHADQFVELTQALTQKPLNYVDTNKTVSVNKLKKYIFHFVDNINVHLSYTKKSYCFVKGLPQGSPLSAVLCEIYYADMDERYFDFCSNEEGDILARAVDDYLFVSRNKERAQKFLSIMENGFTDYGVVVQNEKTKTNLIQDITSASYFGLNINFKNKQIKPNLESYENLNLLSTMSFKTLVNLNVLKQRMLFTHTLKLHKILLDGKYQWKRTIFENIFHAASIMAVRYDCIVTQLLNCEDRLDHNNLLDCIMCSMFKISSASLKKINTERVSHFSLVSIKLVTVKAFIKVLERRRIHQEVVEKLERVKGKYLRRVNNREKKLVSYVGKRFSNELGMIK